MKFIRLFTVFVVVLTAPLVLFAQDSLITQIAKKNLTTFSIENNSFTGNGWDTLITQIKKSDFVLIGEDHLTNEIPFFYSAVVNEVKFDNFFCEIDPYSAKIIESKIKNPDELQLKEYIKEFGDTFSFYAFEPEFQLLKQLVRSNTTIYGTDQIILIADRLICNKLKQITHNNKAKKIYENIEEKSKIYFSEFLKDPNKNFYFFTDEFEKQLTDLLTLDLSEQEKERINALKLSLKIYKEQNHHLRIQLMKNNLMKEYLHWENKKNLFKYGAFHLAKGESLLNVYDLGNLVNNIADSKFKQSLHIMVFGKSGTQSSPFNGYPDQPIDENSSNLEPFKLLLDNVTTDQWHCFDMSPLRTALENGTVVVNNTQLEKIIKGYDYVIIIPEVTSAKHYSM
ncbi:MAG: hypothetical protein WC128_04825 [Bacteroidales bacterium]|jgi:hypothetical protein